MLRALTILLGCAVSSRGITFPAESEACIRTDEPLMPCVLSGAVGWAEKAAGREIHLGQGLVLVPDGTQQDLPSLGDPRETRTLVEAVERAVGQRRLVWGLGWLYPGLGMVVTRGPDPRLYFAVDGRAGGGPGYAEDTGRLIVRRAVVPLLLGVNLKLATLAPVLVAILVLLIKKALALSKLSLLVSGLGLFQQQQQQMMHQQAQQSHVTLEGFPGTRGWSWQQDEESAFNLTNSFF